jgi:hypothetical protein
MALIRSWVVVVRIGVRLLIIGMRLIGVGLFRRGESAEIGLRLRQVLLSRFLMLGSMGGVAMLLGLRGLLLFVGRLLKLLLRGLGAMDDVGVIRLMRLLGQRVRLLGRLLCLIR